MGEGKENACHNHANITGRDPGAFTHPVEDTSHQQAAGDKPRRGQAIQQAVFELGSLEVSQGER